MSSVAAGLAWCPPRSGANPSPPAGEDKGKSTSHTGEINRLGGGGQLYTLPPLFHSPPFRPAPMCIKSRGTSVCTPYGISRVG